MKKFIAALGLLVIFVVNTHTGLYLVNTYVNSDVVETEVGPVPIEQTFGYTVFGDNFYKDFTK